MTYCVGMVLEDGFVMMSDTRTNSGVDNISVFRKMFRWQKPGERIVALMTAGNLATTQAVIGKLEERDKAPGDRRNSLLDPRLRPHNELRGRRQAADGQFRFHAEG